MDLHALYLVQVSTMLSSTMKSTAIKYYLNAASSISLESKQLDLLLDMRGLEAQCIKDVLSEVKLWESIPNHREPVTMKIVLNMHNK